MKFKIALCLFVSFPLCSSDQLSTQQLSTEQLSTGQLSTGQLSTGQLSNHTHTELAMVVRMPNTLTIIDILAHNNDAGSCFCNISRTIEIAEYLAGMLMTRQELEECLYMMAQDEYPIKPNSVCCAKANALMEFALSRI